jgi:prevent-host-death family protein
MITTLREGKAKLSALVERAAGGEEVIITVRGKPRARLCPIGAPRPHEQRDRDKWKKTLREARAIYSTGQRDTATQIIDDLRGDRS